MDTTPSLSENPFNPDLADGERFPEAQALHDESFDDDEFKDPAEVEENISKFWKLNSLKQRKYVRNITLIIDKLGSAKLPFIVSNLFPADRNLMEANHEVAYLLTETIMILLKSIANCEVLRADEQATYKMEAIFLDFLKEIIESSESKLLVSSRRTLITISKMLSKRSCDNNLLTVVLTLMHDPLNENNRVSALELITKLHPLFSRQYIEGFIAMDILAMMQDNSLRVRIESYQTFFALFSSFESEFIEKRFLDVLEGMSNDPNTDIKLIFIRNVPTIGKKLTFKKFEFKVLPKYMDHLASKNRFFREEALTMMAELIVALISTSDSSSLQDVYHSPTFDRIFDSFFDLPKIIAKMNLNVKKTIIKSNYSLLKKVITVKKANVWPKIKKLIIGSEELDSAVVEMAKIEISSQLDAIAQVTDKNTLEKDLILLIDRYYLTISSTTSEKVKQNTIKILAGVLKELNPDIREKYADVYHTTMNQDMRKWRLRWVISEQIDNLSKLFNASTVVSKILPMYFSFCKDNCAVVRKYASKNFWKLLDNVQNDQQGKHIALLNMMSFGKYKRFVLRQSYVLMLEGVLLNIPNCVDQEMIAILQELASDPVVNIRIAVARLLKNVQATNKLPDWFDDIAKPLVSNADEDLYQMLNGHLPTADLQVLLEKSIHERREKLQERVKAERDQVNQLRKAKGLSAIDFTGANSMTLQKNVTGPKGPSYRDVLKEAFDLKSDDEDVKQLMADLNIEVETKELVHKNDRKSASPKKKVEEPKIQEDEPEEIPDRHANPSDSGRRRSNNIIDLKAELMNAKDLLELDSLSPVQESHHDVENLAKEYNNQLVNEGLNALSKSEETDN